MIFSSQKIFTGVVGLILSLLITTHFVAAQTADPLDTTTTSGDTTGQGDTIYETGPTANDVDIIFDPLHPGAFEKVNLRLESDYINLNRYPISWFVNGVKIGEGTGLRDASFTTRGYGQKTSLIVLIKLPDTLIRKTLSFEPQDMTLFWEAVDSYVPPFYPGKKLPSREGIIKAIALPNFTLNNRSFDSEQGVYIWKRNGNTVEGAGGFGKNFFLFKNNKIRTQETVEVQASDTSGSHEANQTVVINFYNPKILFYERNTLTGISLRNALTSSRLTSQSLGIIAEPYFFSTISQNPQKLLYQWMMNNIPIDLTQKDIQNRITLQHPGGTGKAQISLKVNNSFSPFQSADASFPITFSE